MLKRPCRLRRHSLGVPLLKGLDNAHRPRLIRQSYASLEAPTAWRRLGVEMAATWHPSEPEKRGKERPGDASRGLSKDELGGKRSLVQILSPRVRVVAGPDSR